MSVADAPPTGVNGNPGTAVGSPPDGTVQTRQVEEHEDPEGASPEGGEGGGTDPRAELEELRRKYAEAEAERNQYRADMDRLNGDPAIVEFVKKRLSGEADPATDPIEAHIRETFATLDRDADGNQVENGVYAKAFRKFAQLTKEAARAEALREIDARIQSVERTASTGRLASALETHGIDAATRTSSAWKAHVAALESEPDYGGVLKSMRIKRPEAWARTVTTEWKLKSESRLAGKAERERQDRASGARLNTQGQRASASTPRQFVYDPKDPNLMSKRLAAREAGVKIEDFVRKPLR